MTGDAEDMAYYVALTDRDSLELPLLGAETVSVAYFARTEEPDA